MSKTEEKKKIKNGNFADSRITELHQTIDEVAREKAIELQLSIASVIGVLDNIKHEMQHEFTLIPSDNICY